MEEMYSWAPHIKSIASPRKFELFCVPTAVVTMENFNVDLLASAHHRLSGCILT